MDDEANSGRAPAYPTLETMLAVSMTRTVRVLLPAASVVLLVYAVFYAVTLPNQTAIVLTPFCLATASLSGSLWMFVRRWKATDPRIHGVAFLVGSLVAAKSMLHVWLTQSPTGIGTLIFLLILAGAAFVRPWHLFVLSGFVAIGLGACLVQFADSASWLYLGGVAVTASAVGIAVQAARLQTFRALNDAHTQILGQALRDQLTGLANRASLMQRLAECLERRDRGAGDHFVVTYLDLDGLKRVNDIYGHSCGDALIAAVGERLRSSFDGNHFAARVGGDEFVVVSEGVPGEPLAVALANRIHNAVCGTVVRDSHEIPVRASFGWAWSGRGYRTADQILAAADRVMYAMKRARQRALLDGDRTSEGLAALKRAANAGAGSSAGPLRDESGSHRFPKNS